MHIHTDDNAVQRASACRPRRAKERVIFKCNTDDPIPEGYQLLNSIHQSQASGNEPSVVPFSSGTRESVLARIALQGGELGKEGRKEERKTG